MPLSFAHFMERLAASGLPSAAAAQALLETLSAKDRPQDGPALADLLVGRGFLTSFQAKTLLEGKELPLVLDDYVLLDKLGQGGMGAVYRAEHRRMKRPVALKVLSAKALESPDAVQRFQREVYAVAQLHHPNIVSALHAGETAGMPYLVMELVSGSNLQQIVKDRGPLDVAAALAYVRQAALGLAHAHSKGIIHRDIKPSNLLLDQHETVKLLDMGLVRVESAALDFETTQTGTVMGTLDYMSPEQAEDTRCADARSDVYSLGCTLFFLLTGRAPYRGDTTTRKIIAHRDHPIPPLQAERADAPRLVAELLRRMLAKKPEDRPTLPAVIQNLEQALEQVRLAPPPPARKAKRHDRINCQAETLGLTAGAAEGSGQTSGPTQLLISSRRLRLLLPAVAALLVGAGLAWWFWPRPEVNPVVNPRPRPPDQVDIVSAPDRTAAERLLAAGVTVTLASDKKTLVLTQPMDLPKGSIEIVSVNFQPGNNLQASDLDLLVPLKRLEGLTCNTPAFDAPRLAAFFRKGPPIRSLTLGDNQPLSEEVCLALASLPHLTTLICTGQVTAANLESLKSLVNLTHLSLTGPKLPAKEAVKLCAGLTRLKTVELTSTELNDDHLAALKELKNLEHLALPKSTLLGPGVEHLSSLPKLSSLTLDNAVLIDDTLLRVAALKGLTHLYLVNTAVSDAGLLHLDALPNLRIINLTGTKTTAKGADRLRQRKVQVVGLDDPDRDMALWILNRGGSVTVRDVKPPHRTSGIFDPKGLSAEPFHITRISLEDKQGISQPERLKSLAALEELDLAEANSELMQVLAHLPHLRDLMLGVASDEQVREISRLNHLTQLSLSGGKLSPAGLRPLADLKTLRFLALTSDAPANLVTAELAKLQTLQDLKLTLPGLTDNDLRPLEQLKQLQCLRLHQGKITGEGLGRLAALPIDTLLLARCPLDGKGLAQLEGWNNLRSLALEETPLTDADLKVILALNGLEKLFLFNNPKTSQRAAADLLKARPKLYLSYNGLPVTLSTEPDRRAATWALTAGGRVVLKTAGGMEKSTSKLVELPAEPFSLLHLTLTSDTTDKAKSGLDLEGCTSLESLNINCPHIERQDLLKNLPFLPKLRALSVIPCVLEDDDLALLVDKPLTSLMVQFGKLTPKGLTHLGKITSLEVLRLPGIDLTDESLEPIGRLTSLKHLEITGKGITDKGLSHLAKCKHIIDLSLQKTGVTPPGLATLSCTDLVNLNLAFTDLARQSTGRLDRFAKLKQLDLSNSGATDATLADFPSLAKLENLVLHNCPINDAPLKNFAGLPSLVHIDLRGTMVTALGMKKLRENARAKLEISGEKK